MDIRGLGSYALVDFGTWAT